MLRIWSLVGVGERIPGGEGGQDRVVYSVDWDAMREYRECGHPDWDVPDTEQWEIPRIMRQVVAWMNEGASFFLGGGGDDEQEATEIADDEVGTWLT